MTPKGPLAVTFLLASTQFVIALDASIVVIALPSIQRSLGLSVSTAQWVITAYQLAFGGLMLVGGRAADLYGRRRLFAFGTAAFAAASLLAGLAASGAMLLAARTIQGLSGAASAPAALALLTSSVPRGEERHRAIAINGAALSGGFVAGTILGGVLTMFGNWRSVFFVNVPIASAVAVLAIVMIGEDEPGRGEPLDLAGASTVTGGLVALIYAITSFSTALASVAALGAAIALMLAFALIEAQGPAPLIPRRLLAERAVIAASLCALLVNASGAGVFILLTIYLQRILDFTPLQAALVFLVPGAGAVLAGALAERCIARLGPRLTLVSGLALQTTGALTLATLTAQRQLAPVLIGGWLDGFGVVIATITATVVVTATASDVDQGTMAGLFNAATEFGAALGIAIFIAIAGIMLANTPTLQRAAHARATLGIDHAMLAGAGLSTLAALMASCLRRTDAGAPIARPCANHRLHEEADHNPS